MATSHQQTTNYGRNKVPVTGPPQTSLAKIINDAIGVWRSNKGADPRYIIMGSETVNVATESGLTRYKGRVLHVRDMEVLVLANKLHFVEVFTPGQ